MHVTFNRRMEDQASRICCIRFLTLPRRKTSFPNWDIQFVRMVCSETVRISLEGCLKHI